MATTRTDINNFLACRRIALVGASRDPKDFSRAMLREMCQRGYDMVPVNPSASELDGRPCFARVQDIHPSVEGALIMTSPRDTERVVHDCAEAGITRIWLHRGGGQGSISREAVEFCNATGMSLVEGHCPFMFLPGTQFFHRVHGFFLRLSGRYPAAR
jgi:predicted CoA-binding protein